MDPREKRAAAEQLALLELLLAAQARRHEVMDAVWDASDKEQASDRLRDLLGISDGADPLIVLDMQIWRLTADARSVIQANAAQLRHVLGSG
jgi:hypothetical protein